MVIKMKKFRMILLSAAVIIAMLFVNIVSASAATYFSDGKYTFAKNGDGTITIVSYDLEDGDMVMPESIFGDTVVAVKNLAFTETVLLFPQLSPKRLRRLAILLLTKLLILQLLLFLKIVFMSEAALCRTVPRLRTLQLTLL